MKNNPIWKVVSEGIWKKHNPARNKSHADYGNPNYVINRIQSDEKWITERDDSWNMYSRFTIC